MGARDSHVRHGMIRLENAATAAYIRRIPRFQSASAIGKPAV
jgi:hypothetical protein